MEEVDGIEWIQYDSDCESDDDSAQPSTPRREKSKFRSGIGGENEDGQAKASGGDVNCETEQQSEDDDEEDRPRCAVLCGIKAPIESPGRKDKTMILRARRGYGLVTRQIWLIIA